MRRRPQTEKWLKINDMNLRSYILRCQIRKLTAGRQLPNWEFSTLFLVKDSLAVMLESASLCEDALREYTELEALFLTTTQQQPGNNGVTAFGEHAANPSS